MDIASVREWINTYWDTCSPMLIELRKVQRGEKPAVGWEWLEELKKTKPLEFIREVTRAEREFREMQLQCHKDNPLPEEKRVELDEAGEKLIETMNEWLSEKASTTPGKTRA